MRSNPGRSIASAALTMLWCVLAILSPQAAYAHGGVIIDGSLTQEYEWLIAVSPYPVTPGDTVITLLIYELDTYAPVNGLDTALYLTPPDSSERAGPFELLADPEQYPGDYSNIFDIDQEGAWGVTFVVNTESETLELSSTFTVQPGNPNDARPTAEGAADVAATATAFAQNVADARQTGPEAEATAVITGTGAAPISDTEAVTLSDTASEPEMVAAPADTDPGTDTERNAMGDLARTFRRNTWLWILVGALPFGLLFLWFLRAPTLNENAGNESADDEAAAEVD